MYALANSRSKSEDVDDFEDARPTKNVRLVTERTMAMATKITLNLLFFVSELSFTKSERYGEKIIIRL